MKGTAVKARGFLGIVGVCAALCLSGCVQTFNANQKVFSRYYATTLKLSTSASVLSYLQDPETELLSQSENVAVSWGGRDKGETHWFNMVAFAEEDLTAVRKYSFALVERHLMWNSAPTPTLRFDAEVVLEPDVLEGEYAGQNARLIAVLNAVKTAFHDDGAEVIADGAGLRSSVMMVNQALNAAATELVISPALAVNLPKLEGLTFQHPTLGEGRVRMLIEDDIVKLKIKATKRWLEKPFEKQSDVQNM